MRTIYYLLDLLGITFCCLFICSCSKNDPDNTLPATGSGISVMTFNIRMDGDTDEHRWDNRKTACLDMINDKDPDVIGMQEVRPGQKAWFDANLGDYETIGVARDGSSKTEYSSIYYRADVFTLLDNNTFWLSATPDIVSKGWDAAYYRICTWGKFKVKSTGKELFFFNTHLDNIGTEAQKQGLHLIKEKIKEIAGDGAIVILTGDFNMQPDNANIIDFTTYMNNTRNQFLTTGGNYGTFNNWGSSNSIIDYIWYRNASPTSHEVVRDSYAGVRYISDHYPVMATFDLN
ncbi:MAG: endonuclease/exonuclease/phosphatase family protein [Mangrovibacterium sp.]